MLDALLRWDQLCRDAAEARDAFQRTPEGSEFVDRDPLKRGTIGRIIERPHLTALLSIKSRETTVKDKKVIFTVFGWPECKQGPRD
jgi:hypothetical protein